MKTKTTESKKAKTALRHIKTVEKASERVSSWPSWKRDVTFFRDYERFGVSQSLISMIQNGRKA